MLLDEAGPPVVAEHVTGRRRARTAVSGAAMALLLLIPFAEADR
jgi:hypothetical protein